MRSLTAGLGFLLAALLMTSSATAQEHAGCSQEEPCTWIVDVDEQGIEDNTFDGTVYNGTAGDWYTVNITNFDPEDEHTVVFGGYGMSWTIASIDAVESEPFLLDQNGTFRLIDDPTGDTATVNVLFADVVEEEQGGGTGGTTSDGGRGAPGLELAAFTGLLALAAWVRRT